VAVHTGIVTAEEISLELSEANQLLAMVKSAVRTARLSASRGVVSFLLALCSLLYALS
jgi:hypothetical protein